MVKAEVGKGDLAWKRSREWKMDWVLTEGCCMSFFGRHFQFRALSP